MKKILLLLLLFLFLFITPVEAADNPVRETDVSTASDGNEIVLLEGTFNYLTKEDILSRINEIRLEACKEGVWDPRNPSRALTEADYVEIKWSSDLEWIAQTRAAEATVHMDHTRPNDKSWSGVSYNGISSNSENLAWNGTADILGGINQWYREKSDWINNASGAGHYRSIINPRYTYIGIGAFRPSTGYGAVAGELKIGSGLNENQSGAKGAYQQKVEIKKANLTISPATAKTIHLGKTENLSLNAETSYENDLGSSWSPKVSKVKLMGETSWGSSNTQIAAVNSQGLVNGISAGTATVTAKYNGNEYKTTITVEDHKWVEKSSIPPTCIEPGSTSYKCSICGQTYEKEFPATGHSWNDEYTVDKEATCKEEGSKSIHCKTCGAKDESTITVIPKKDHDYTDWVTIQEATCTKDGKKTRGCNNCDLKEEKAIPATGHKAGEPVRENVQEAGCETTGSYDEVIYCSSCGQELSREDRVLPATGHTWNKEYTIDQEATCTEEGSKSIHCKTCGAKDESTITVLPKKDHDYTNWVTTQEATCTKDGKMTRGCNNCDLKEEEAISATGHIWNEEYTIDQEATCTSKGEESIHCSVCDKIKDGSPRSINKKNHEFGEWKTVKEATTEVAGLKERTCKNCGASEQEEIPKTVPSSPTVPVVPSVPTVIPAEITPSNPVALASVDKQITTAKSDADPQGSVFNLLQAKGVAKSNTSVKISWKRVPGASTYIIYANKCGANNQFIKLNTVSGTSFTQTKLKKGTYYKYLIVAVNGDKALATSKTIHVATKGGKVGNHKSVTTKAKKNKVSLKRGKSFKLGAKAVAQSKKLKVKKHRGIAYESSNKSIASVSGKGVIKAVGKGTCYVFAYAQNGVCRKIKVTVK